MITIKKRVRIKVAKQTYEIHRQALNFCSSLFWKDAPKNSAVKERMIDISRLRQKYFSIFECYQQGYNFASFSEHSPYDSHPHHEKLKNVKLVLFRQNSEMKIYSFLFAISYLRRILNK